MRTVYKYEFPIEQSFSRPTARIVKILRVTPKTNDIGTIDGFTVWAEVDSDIQETNNFYTVGTGNPIPLYTKYCGTIDAGVFVWHLYMYDQERANLGMR